MCLRPAKIPYFNNPKYITFERPRDMTYDIIIALSSPVATNGMALVETNEVIDGI